MLDMRYIGTMAMVCIEDLDLSVIPAGADMYLQGAYFV